MTSSVHALSGSGIDGSWYLDATEFARETPWLNGLLLGFSSFGIALFAGLILLAWWIARRADAATMTAAIAVPIAAVTAYLINDGLKSAVAERRPCFTYPHAFLLEKCPPASDYSFPSNHTVVAAAMAAALFLIDRRLGVVATVATALMGLSRIYVGAHYPHDVAAAVVVGVIVGLATTGVLRKYAIALVEKLSTGPLRPILTARPMVNGQL
ncbi:phosphatase PAP2 family protein [Nocardia acidivorans]|uniref:phosphatase PAP2 family protein n=1 Tax=Nocardia acidivorans TaxID=404580 RepID=UPI0008352DA6|nr:phosphatase PAP2 family protein [Nocardia acidivorans]